MNLSSYSNIFFPICSLAISLFLMIIFFAKKNIKNNETKIYSYLMTVFRMGTTKLHQFSLPIDGGYTSQIIRGQQCLVPDLDVNKAALKKFIFKS